MARWIYKVALVIALPAVFVRLWLRSRREPDYGLRWAERLGRVADDVPSGVIWFHTVSAGETIAAAPLIRRLAQQYGDLPFLVTTMTPTGSDQVKRLLNDVVSHCYAPYDFPFAVRRFLDRVRPRMLVLMETELWPNTIEQAHRRGLPVFLVNARLSARSAAGYARAGALTRTMLQQLTYIAAQSEEHVERFVALGAPQDRMAALGSVKYDIQLPDSFAEQCARRRAALGLTGRPVWIAASTHPGEDEQVLRAHRQVVQQLPDARLLLVPRHPVRADDICEMAVDAGFTVARLSELTEDGSAAADLLVGDVMGQLQQLYGIADVAFVGGSLVAHGGHNPLEPAACGMPVLSGPHRFNFSQITDELAARNGLLLVNDAAELSRNVVEFLRSPSRRQEVGASARGALDENRGTTDRLAQLLGAEIRALSDD